MAAGTRRYRIRQHTVNAKTHVEVVTCYKLTAGHAEIAGARWAQRWIDVQLTTDRVD
jgi:hypothetical protein